MLQRLFKFNFSKIVLVLFVLGLFFIWQKLDINKVSLKIHRFDENNKEKSQLIEEIKVEDIKEDFLIDKLGQLKDKSEDQGVDKNDLKDNIYEQ